MKQIILLLGLVPSISKTHSVRTLMLGLLLFFGISSSTFAASISYTGASGGNWNVASNWGGGALPTLSDDVTIVGKTVLIQSGDAITINRLIIQTSASAAGILNITGGSLTINQTTGTASNEACILMGGTINNSAGTVSITNAIASGTGAGLRLASANAGTFSSTFNNAGTGTLSINTTATTTSWPCITINQNTASTTPTLTVGGTITLTPNPGTVVGVIDVNGSAPAQINGTGTINIGSALSPVGYSFLRCASGNQASFSATIETGVTLNYYGNNNTNVSCLYISTSGTTAAKSATITNKGTINVGGTTRNPISISGASTLSGSTASFVNQGTLTANGAFAGNTTPGVIFMAGGGYSNVFTNSGTINFNTSADQTTDCSVIKVYGNTVNASIANSGTINVDSSQALTNAIVLTDSKSTLTNTGTINIATGQITGTSGTGYTGSAAFNNNAGAFINTSKTNQTTAFTSTIALTNNGTINYNFPNINGNVNLSTLGNCSNCDLSVSNGGELVIDATKTLKSLSIAAGGKLTINAALTTTNGLTLQSDANGTATMLNSGTYTGTVTANQYLGSARNWYVSSPVQAATSPANNITRYYEYVEAGDNNYPKDGSNNPINIGETSYWKYWATGNSMTVGKGYISQANAETTVSFSGTPNNGPITTSFDLTRNDTKGKGFNLVGNPYPSYIDWTVVATANPNLENTYYYRTKNTVNAYTFVTYNGSGSSYVVSNGTANTNITHFIPPTQAFWVKVKTNNSNTKMYFNNDMREHRDDNGNLMKAPKQDQRKTIRLQIQNGTESDELLIYQDAAASNEYDSFDSPKMMNNSATIPDLYSKAGNERLVINGLNAVTDNMELPLGFSLNAAATLKLKATQLSNFAEGTK
ncbi:MAG: hypothetical protein GZ091_08310, partial [Paludibacter sp.]|nr:hypothetical protein [Paludibacter sp.]